MFLFDDQTAGLKIYFKIEENTKISSVEAKTTLSREAYYLWFLIVIEHIPTANPEENLHICILKS